MSIPINVQEQLDIERHRTMAKELAKKQELTTINFEQHVGKGFEDVQAKDLQIPFLYLLQKLSPAVDEADPAYVKGAKAGMFINNVTKEVFDTLRVVPVYFTSASVEWKPNRGGFVGQHKSTSETVLTAKQITDSNGRRRTMTKTGNELVDTHYMHVLYRNSPDPNTEKWEHAVIAFTSTQLKKSRQWLTNTMKYTMPNGQPYPMFAFTYNLAKILESNDAGNWWGYTIIRAEDHPIQDESLFQQAIKAYEQVKAGIGTLVHDIPVEQEVF